MPNLPAVSGNQVARALRRGGFVRLRQVGSHATFQHPETGRRTLVKMGSKDLKAGTLHGILEQAGLTDAEFLSLLK
jgi:predicted RNA binding protein YcfA (HicA-like mRNA interferase family)